MSIKVLTVFGTRPEAIKMAPLIKKLKSDNRFECVVCSTGQHREMLDSVLETFDIVPDFDLKVMSENQALVDISNKILDGVDKVVKRVKPNIVLVHGDTTTTLNGALAGFYNKVDIGHIEAGLRSNDIYSPFPEEMNRRLTSELATLHFAPTENNKENLISEKIDSESIFVTGNTVIDALHCVVEDDYEFCEKNLRNLNFETDKYVLLTTHRRENIGEYMENIFSAVLRLVESDEKVKVIFPVHKNNKVREIAKKYFKEADERVILLEPLDYSDFSNLINRVDLIMTDSGGIQEEAPTFRKPVLVLRKETERIEAIKSGVVRLVGVNEDDIFNNAYKILNSTYEYSLFNKNKNPYGDGRSSERIVGIIADYFNEKGIY